MRSHLTDGLPIEHSDTLFVATLLHHQRDPFDRLLIAQAELKHLILATADPVFGLYTHRTISP